LAASELPQSLTFSLSSLTPILKNAFYHFYDFVPVGGVVIMDDYFSHDGARDSWADFQRDQGFSETVLHVNERWDAHGGWFIKTVHVNVDFTKMHVLAVDE
jgi:hypothetical protein